MAHHYPKAIPHKKVRHIYLIGCGKKKKSEGEHPAQELYRGNLYRERRHYVIARAHAAQWGILSAKYGFLVPQDVIKSYDLHLSALDKSARMVWAERVWGAILARWPNVRTVEVHAGWTYLDCLVAKAPQQVEEITCPTSGLGLGQQLGFYKEARS